VGVGRAEPPVYRPFALLAFGTAAAAGVPLGIWLLTRLHWGGGPVPPAWLLLHAHLQIFGLFGVLILGVAHHLVPRFVGRPVTADRAPALFGLVALGLALRVGGTAAGRPSALVVATLLEAAAFLLFTAWLRRALAPAPLALTRWHLALATAWLVAALLLEAALRWKAMAGGATEPDPRGIQVVYLMALLGGVGGWMLGVALRAAPMFVAGWRVPPALAWAAPWTLALSVVIGGAGEATGAVALAKLGEAVAVGTIATVAVTGGALGRRRAPRSLLARGGPELWLFRLAMTSAAVAAVGLFAAAVLAWRGVPLSLLADALRHLVTVGFLTSMAVGMAFRLIPVFEGVPVPWPRLPALAFPALLGGVLLRSGEVLADWLWTGLLPWLPLSGLLVWLAVASVFATVLGATPSRRGAAAPPRSPG